MHKSASLDHDTIEFAYAAGLEPGDTGWIRDKCVMARDNAEGPVFSPTMAALLRAISEHHGLDRKAATGCIVLQHHRGEERLMFLRVHSILAVAQLNCRSTGQYEIDHAVRYNITSYGLLLDRELQDVRWDQGFGTVDRPEAEHAHLLRAQRVWTATEERWAERLLEDGWPKAPCVIKEGF